MINIRGKERDNYPKASVSPTKSAPPQVPISPTLPLSCPPTPERSQEPSEAEGSTTLQLLHERDTKDCAGWSSPSSSTTRRMRNKKKKTPTVCSPGALAGAINPQSDEPIEKVQVWYRGAAFSLVGRPTWADITVHTARLELSSLSSIAAQELQLRINGIPLEDDTATCDAVGFGDPNALLDMLCLCDVCMATPNWGCNCYTCFYGSYATELIDTLSSTTQEIIGSCVSSSNTEEAPEEVKMPVTTTEHRKYRNDPYSGQIVFLDGP